MKREAYKKLKQATDEAWLGVSDVWLTAQTIFPGIYRWKKYKKCGIRPQDDLQHSYSVSVLAKIFVEMIGPYNPGLDKELIISAFLVHDHGEGELKRDNCFDFKKSNDDVAEYLAFVKRYQQLGPKIFPNIKRAYLLQHALNERPDFPMEAQVILKDLRKNNFREVLSFRAIEIWDYLLYPLEQNKNQSRPKILIEVARNQTLRMEELAKHLPGFKEQIWTEKVAKLYYEISQIKYHGNHRIPMKF
jgi:hypothetical protein